MQTKPLFLGIDPGLATTGWAILVLNEGSKSSVDVVNYGVITTRKDVEIGQRLCEIYDDLSTIIEQYKPTLAGVETLLFCNNAKTAIAVGQARGVVLTVLAKAGIQRRDFTPLEIKKFITGYGRASKKQVQECVSMMAGIEGRVQDDACDAIAVGMLVCSTGQAEQL